MRLVRETYEESPELIDLINQARATLINQDDELLTQGIHELQLSNHEGINFSDSEDDSSADDDAAATTTTTTR